MNKRLSGLCLLLAGMCFINVSVAADNAQEDITKSLARIFPGVTPTITPSPMEGVSEVLVGPRLM